MMVSVAAPSTLDTLDGRWASGARSRCAARGFRDARESFRAPGRFGGRRVSDRECPRGPSEFGAL